MGGVTDSPTVIRQLKSVFPRKVKIQDGDLHLQTDSFIFRIYTSLTPVIFLILAGLIFWQRMTAEHINCYSPAEVDDEDLRAQAVNQYCFVTGTYTVTGYPQGHKNFQKRLPYPGVGPHVPGSGTEVKYHLYFQWVPFVLLVQAIILMLPRPAWKWALKDGLSRYCESIIMSGDEDPPKLETLYSQSPPEKISLPAKRFFRNLKNHNTFSRWYIICEICTLLIALGCLYLSDKLLTGDFSDLGWKWIQFLLSGHTQVYRESAMNTTTSPLDLIFPKMSKCEFKMFGPSGGIINYDILCVLTLNVIHDKIFLFQWFWLGSIIFAQFINLLYKLILCFWKDRRLDLILNRIEPGTLNDPSENSDVNDSTNYFKKEARIFVASLSYHDWFMLDKIGKSTDAIKFTGFLHNLIYFSKKKVHHHYGHINDPNSDDRQHLLKSQQQGKGFQGWRKESGNYMGNLRMGMIEMDGQRDSHDKRRIAEAISYDAPDRADDNRHYYQQYHTDTRYSNLPPRREADIMQVEVTQESERKNSIQNLMKGGGDTFYKPSYGHLSQQPTSVQDVGDSSIYSNHGDDEADGSRTNQ